MRRALLLSGLLLGLGACGDDPGFPWPDELSADATAGASSWARYDVTRIWTAVEDTDPLAGVPEGCGTLSGSLTAGGDPKDTDLDGIPDNLTITITRANCDSTAFGFIGKFHVSDPGTTPGYDYNADLSDTMSSAILIRHSDTRHIRYNGATTTGSIDYREWWTVYNEAGEPSEESGYSADFTLTPTGGPTLAAGVYGPATLAFTGWIDRKDEVGAIAGPWRFSIRGVTAVTLDPGCGELERVTSGAIEGSLNGSGPAKFTQTWSACGTSVITTEGTTD